MSRDATRDDAPVSAASVTLAPASDDRGAKVIAVAGNMGAGKSSLVEWLRQQFGMRPFFEPNEENPYLEDFYEDMERWAFNSQIWFLIRRFHIHKTIDTAARENSQPVVQDRTIYEDAEIFAAHLHAAGHISERDWESYQDLYQTLKAELRPPDLMIYLRCPLKTLVKRIHKRGRAFEQKVPRKYLRNLENLYESWLDRYDASPKLVLETDRLDYVEHLFDRLELLRAIERHVGIEPLRRR